MIGIGSKNDENTKEIPEHKRSPEYNEVFQKHLMASG
jgi:hypothetical protein